MMMRKSLSVLVAALSCCVLLLQAAAAVTGDGTAARSYRYAISLEGYGEYKAVQLGEDVYTRSARGLANLRVVDGEGEQVPYFLYSGRETAEINSASFPGGLVYQYTESGDSYYDFAIEKAENEDVYGNRLLLRTATDGFAKQVRVWGSHDGNSWTYLTEALVFNVDQHAQLEIPFDDMEKYSYYRLGVPNDQEVVDIGSIELQFRQTVASMGHFEAAVTPGFERREDGDSTIVSVPGAALRNLQLTGLSIQTSSMFQRRVETPLGRDTLYHLEFQGQTLHNTTLEFSAAAYGEADFEIEIANGDDAPIDIDSLTFTYRCDRVVFKAEPGSEYFLLLDAAAQSAPSYDIEGYADLILTQGVDLGSYTYDGAIEGEPATVAGLPLEDTWIFSAVLAMVSLLLIFLIVRTALGKNKKGNQQEK